MTCSVCSAPVAPTFRFCSQCGSRLDDGESPTNGDGHFPRGNDRSEPGSPNDSSTHDRYRLYVDHSPHGVFIVNRQGRYLEVNPAASRITGYSADELTTLSIADMLPYEAREQGFAAFQQVLKLGRFEGDFPFVKKCGTKGWWSVSAVKLTEDRMLGMVADITSRKDLEDSLLRTRSRLQFVIRSSLTVFYACEAVEPFATTFISDNVETQLGYSPASFTADKGFWAERIHPEDRSRIVKGMQRLRRPGHHRYEYRFRHGDGTWRWLRDDITLVRDEAGKPVEMIGAMYDITENKRAEANLRESEERYRNFVEHATDAFFLHGKDGIICDVNSRAADSLGYSRDELIGQQVSRFDPNANADVMAKIGEQLARGEIITFESSHRRKDGCVFPVEVRLRGFESHGEFLAISLVRDISQRVDADVALRESEERLRLALASANQGLWDQNVETGSGVVSPEYATMLGYDPEGFVETIDSLIARMHPDDVSHTLQAFEAYLSGESSSYRVEFRQKTASGEWKWILSCGKIIQWSADGRPLRMLGTHTDISAFKTVEAELRLVNTAMASSLNGVAIAGLDGRLSYVNRSFLDMWGYESDDQVLGRSPTEFWVEPQRAAAIMQTLLERESYFGELTAVRNDGGTFEAQMSAALIRDPDGQATHIMGSFIDVTDSKRQREELQHSQSRLSEAQRIAKIGSWELDLLHNHLEWSDEAYRIFGIDKATSPASNETFFNAVHPDDRELVDRAYQRSLETREPYQISHRLCRPDGSIKWVTERCVSYFDEQGRPLRSVGTVQDVTEQKHAEEQLIAAHQRLRDILDSLFGFVGVCNTDGILVEINRAPLDATGLTRDEVLGHPVWELPWTSFSTESQNQLRDAVRRAATGEIVRREIQGLAANGEFMSVDTNFGPLRDLQGNITHIIGFGVDITARKLAEEKMANLRDELAHVHRVGVMGELASGLAHELNQPLSALALYASTAQLLAAGGKGNDLKPILTKIGEQALRAGQIIRGMRSLVNRDDSQQAEIAVNDVVADALGILEYDLKHQLIGVTLQLDERLPPVQANRIQIMQVLVNLVRNAVEAMSHTPPSDRVLTIQTARDEGGMRLTVSDTGCGFGDAAAQKLFHPLQSSKPNGMGMGLAISRNLIEAHDGKIEAKSPAGRGASFTFWLPLSGSTASVSPAGRESSS